MKKLFSLLIIVTLIMMASSCGTSGRSSSDLQLQKQTEVMMQEANKQIGMPAITNFQEKKVLKWVYELRDRADLICYAYLFDEMHGRVGQYLGKCIGYGIPYGTQFSNPEKIVDYAGSAVSHYSFGPIPQPEPNGLFMPEGLNATWLLLLDKDGKLGPPVYIEPSIIVSPFPLKPLLEKNK